MRLKFVILIGVLLSGVDVLGQKMCREVNEIVNDLMQVNYIASQKYDTGLGAAYGIEIESYKLYEELGTCSDIELWKRLFNSKHPIIKFYSWKLIVQADLDFGMDLLRENTSELNSIKISKYLNACQWYVEREALDLMINELILMNNNEEIYLSDELRGELKGILERDLDKDKVVDVKDF